MFYSKERLEAYNLYSLREIAWQIGVKSPTNKSKSQLVQAIMEVAKGKVSPCTTNRGRRKLHNTTTQPLPPITNEMQLALIDKLLDEKLHDIKKDLINIIKDN